MAATSPASRWTKTATHGMADARLRAREWTTEHGEDHPEIANWTWPGDSGSQ